MRFIRSILILIFLTGCQTLSSKQQAKTKEEMEAMRSIAGAVSGKQLNDQEFKDLAQQVQKDPQAQSAVGAITGSLGGETVRVKYCPVDGQRFSSRIKECPDHHVELKYVDE